MRDEYSWAAPFRQDDARWANEVMWNRDKVIRIATRECGFTKRAAEQLLCKWPGGNTIGTDGCFITCIAMVLKILDDLTGVDWNPAIVNRKAIETVYYTPCGLSMASLYGDMCSDFTFGNVQMIMKEEYPFSGEEGCSVTCSQSHLLQRYLSMKKSDASNFSAVIKIGTYEDTIGSHYVVANPFECAFNRAKDNIRIWDPALPLDAAPGDWTLNDSYQHLRTDSHIGRAMTKEGISDLQIQGIWVFSRWYERTENSFLAEPLMVGNDTPLKGRKR